MMAGTMVFTSCDDDDDDVKTPDTEQTDPKMSEKGSAMLTMLGAVAHVRELPDNWEGDYTVEPTIGVVTDASNPYVRSLAVANAEEALAVYNNITGQQLGSGTTSNTWQQDGIGTITYQANSSTDVTATITFNVKQVPHLQKLLLVPAAAIGDNGTFTGEPYYYIGDVVRDKDDCYWICARPAYSPAKKEDSHWFSFQLVEKNYKVFTANKNRLETTVPTGLGEETEKLKYLMQVLSIAANKGLYPEMVVKGGPMEDGFANLGTNYADSKFVDVLANGWDNVFQSGKTGLNKADFSNPQSNIYVFYNGYSSPAFSSTMKLYYMYFSGLGHSIANKAKLEWDMDDKVKFNIRNYVKNHTKGDNQVGPDKAYVVRYKDGADLQGTFRQPDPTQPIKGVTDIYLYRNLRGKK